MESRLPAPDISQIRARLQAPGGWKLCVIVKVVAFRIGAGAGETYFPVTNTFYVPGHASSVLASASSTAQE